MYLWEQAEAKMQLLIMDRADIEGVWVDRDFRRNYAREVCNNLTDKQIRRLVKSELQWEDTRVIYVAVHDRLRAYKEQREKRDDD